jgi:hypothetical protein
MSPHRRPIWLPRWPLRRDPLGRPHGSFQVLRSACDGVGTVNHRLTAHEAGDGWFSNAYERIFPLRWPGMPVPSCGLHTSRRRTRRSRTSSSATRRKSTRGVLCFIRSVLAAASFPALASSSPAWGTRNGRSLAPGAKTPWNLVRFARGTRHQGRQATQQLQPGEEEVRGAVRQRSLHPIGDAAVLRS